MRIIDCFVFYNELDLLKYRIDVYSEIVDYFVIVESKYTFSGNEKELYYENNKSHEIFERNKDKIIHIILDKVPYIYPNIDYSKNQQWINERFQRNNIINGILKINEILKEKENIKLDNNDLIIINDVDEFTDYNLLEHLKNNKLILDINVPYILNQNMYYYNLNTYVGEWNHSKMLSYKVFLYLISKGKTIDNIRMGIKEIQHNLINRGGWHLSYFGDIHYIKNKLTNFSHQEFNNETYTNLKTIKNKIKTQKNLFDSKQLINIPLSHNLYLPYKYENYLKQYIQETK